MPKARPVSQLFAGAQQSHGTLQLKDRVVELEEEIERLRNLDGSSESAELERQIQELTKELAQKGGEHEIPIDLIQPDPNQPRTIFPESIIEARAKSLKEDGQLTPVILIPLEDGTYRLFEGALRHLAAPRAGMTHLRAVFRRTNDDLIEIFDRQVTTSIQAEKLHGLDLAKALVKLIIGRYPEFQNVEEEIPSFLNASIQRLKRAGKVHEFDKLTSATAESQQQWLASADLREDERKVLRVILGKQLNPASVNANIIPLLKLPEDIQDAMCKGLEASKAKEVAKLTAQRLQVDERQVITLRQTIAQEALDQQWSLATLQKRIQKEIQNSVPTPVAPIVERTIQRVKALKIEAEDGVDLADLKQIEKALQEKIAEVRKLIRSAGE